MTFTLEHKIDDPALPYHTFRFFLVQRGRTSTSRHSGDTRYAELFTTLSKMCTILASTPPTLSSTWTKLLSSSEALKESEELRLVPI
ncbi:hypothetical protein J007_01886 [Cryptococcus neoformans]|nr:hypothetical protein J007_01886 [Cryptococcus neoformans var. grubii]OXC62691.1 hypothetical protein C358_01931 [Cryptococcus neoformans var. grubii MW-RSA852]